MRALFCVRRSTRASARVRSSFLFATGSIPRLRGRSWRCALASLCFASPLRPAPPKSFCAEKTAPTEPSPSTHPLCNPELAHQTHLTPFARSLLSHNKRRTLARTTAHSQRGAQKVDTEETPDLVAAEHEPGPLGGTAGSRLGGLMGQAPRGLHGCAAIAAPTSPPPSSSTQGTPASPEEGGKGRRGSVRSPPTPSGAPRPYGSPEPKKLVGGGRKKRGSLSPAVRGSREGEEEGGAGGRMLRRFRTKVGGCSSMQDGVLVWCGLARTCVQTAWLNRSRADDSW